jgi:chorismate mutase-like protein
MAGADMRNGRDHAAEARAMHPEIETWRAEIDRIDAQLLELVNQRAHCAIEIGMVKRKHSFALDVPEREAQIVERLTQQNSGPLDGEAIGRLFEAIIGESRIAERAMVEG